MVRQIACLGSVADTVMFRWWRRWQERKRLALEGCNSRVSGFALAVLRRRYPGLRPPGLPLEARPRHHAPGTAM
jgi:hypothetical protein